MYFLTLDAYGYHGNHTMTNYFIQLFFNTSKHIKSLMFLGHLLSFGHQTACVKMSACVQCFAFVLEEHEKKKAEMRPGWSQQGGIGASGEMRELDRCGVI